MWERDCRNLALIFLLLFSINFIAAQEINLDYPNEVYIGEEFDFEIEIINFSENVYDVKIDITANGERIAQIYDINDEKYKSTYYYVDSVSFSESKSTLKLNVTSEYVGGAEIMIKLRSGSSVETFENYTIEIVEKPIEESEEIVEENDKEISEEENKDEEEMVEENGEKIDNEIVLIKGNTTSENDVVEQQSIKNPESSQIVYKSKNEKMKIFALYGFSLFCLFIITLLIFDRKK